MASDGKLKKWLDTAQGVAVIAACVVLIYVGLRGRAASNTSPKADLPSAPVPLEKIPTLGNPSAKVGFVIFTDYECPFCGRFARETWPLLRAKYVDTGKVLVAQWHRPLPAIHRSARRAAGAVSCAGTVGQKYWQMSDLLFADQKKLDEGSLVTYAIGLGLNEPAFRTCLTGTIMASVTEEEQRAEGFGVTSTPTFFLGLNTGQNSVKVTQRLAGAMPFDRLASELDKVVASAR